MRLPAAVVTTIGAATVLIAGTAGAAPATETTGSTTPARHAVAGAAKQEFQPTISGGYRAETGRGMALIRRKGKAICSGSIIASKWVLTAKHCLHNAGPYSVKVKFRKRVEGNGIVRGVHGMVWHPKVDMALLELKSPVHNVRYMKLARHNPKVNALNRIKGWGCTAPEPDYNSCTMSTWLRGAEVQVSYFGIDGGGRKRHIFSFGVTGTACNHDSGGPQLRLSNGRQVGVIIGAPTTCSTGFDVKAVSVPTHLGFIREFVPSAGT